MTNWIGLVCATPVVFWAGWPFFERGWASIVNRSPNMFTLIALGVGAAYLFSVAATLAPQLFPAGFRVHGVVETYFDTAVVITVLVLLGQVLELRARGRTSAAIRAAARPGAANGAGDPRRRGARCPDRATCRSAIVLRVRPGEKVPVDGVVVEGAARSTSRWSPASRCRSRRRPARSVTGGTLNGTGSLLMRAERVGSDTLLAQIVRMVGEAQRTRAPIQRLADRVAGVVRAGGGRRRRRWRSWPGRLWGPEPRLAHRAGQRGRGADHRLSVRARPGDADGDHGRHRPRRAARAC